MEVIDSDIAALVILFNPDDSVFDNLQSYNERFERLYVIDNSEQSSESVLRAIKSLTNVRYFSNDGNQGIANALNVGAAQASKDGYEWVLTMDQDSSFEPKTLIKYLQCASMFKNSPSIAIMAPNFLAGPVKTTSCLYSLRLTVIASGNLLNLAVYKILGGFNEALFIDEVDHDYCLRANRAGFTVVQFDDIALSHQIGAAVKFSFGSIRRSRTVHSPIRHYYIARNFLYIFFKYRREFPAYVYWRLLKVARTLLFVLLFGPHKLERLKYILVGMFHYSKSQMGRYRA